MAVAPVSYASALIESLRAAPAGGGQASEVFLLPNPDVPSAVVPQRQRSTPSTILNTPQILSMPAYVGTRSTQLPGRVSEPTPQNTLRPPSSVSDSLFRDELLFGRSDAVRPISPDLFPGVDDDVPPLINPDDLAVPDLGASMPNVSPSINPDYLPQIAEPEPLIDPNDIEVPEVGMPAFQTVQPISPGFLTSVYEPGPLIDPDQIEIPDLERLMVPVEFVPDKEAEAAETFPVVEQSIWEPVDIGSAPPPPRLPRPVKDEPIEDDEPTDEDAFTPDWMNLLNALLRNRDFNFDSQDIV